MEIESKKPFSNESSNTTLIWIRTACKFTVMPVFMYNRFANVISKSAQRRGRLKTAESKRNVMIACRWQWRVFVKRHKKAERLEERWPRLSKQNLRVDKWSVCRG